MLLIGNAGPAMFRRFARERSPGRPSTTGAAGDRPALRIARRRARSFPSTSRPHALPHLGATRRLRPCLAARPQHPSDLWSVARLPCRAQFPADPGLPRDSANPHPCHTCIERPCLTACPVEAFTERPMIDGASGISPRRPAKTACCAAVLPGAPAPSGKITAIRRADRLSHARFQARAYGVVMYTAIADKLKAGAPHPRRRDGNRHPGARRSDGRRYLVRRGQSHASRCRASGACRLHPRRRGGHHRQHLCDEPAALQFARPRRRHGHDRQGRGEDRARGRAPDIAVAVAGSFSVMRPITQGTDRTAAQEWPKAEARAHAAQGR